MDLSSFTIILTEKCNFNCIYCYQEKKYSKEIDLFTIEKAIDFFYPHFTKEFYFNFFGGEPLLAFEKIKQTIHYLGEKNSEQKKKITFSFTTNGSLIKKDILEFLNYNKFLMLLSFDGLAQDITRKKGSFKRIVPIIKEILEYPDIDLETNSVFTPETVKYLSKSMEFITGLGVKNIDFTFNTIEPWANKSMLKLKEELVHTREFLTQYYKKNRSIPVSPFRPAKSKGVFWCAAGTDRLTLTPDGKLWGCHRLSDFFKGKEETKDYKKYFFGTLDSFIKNYKILYPEILKNYSTLCQDYFWTSGRMCVQCEWIETCGTCPFTAAHSGSVMGKIPAWMCEIRRSEHKEKQIFIKEIENMKDS